MPRKPGVYFSRGWFVTKAGRGDGTPVKLAPAKNKSDRDARREAERELQQLLAARDRGPLKPVSQLTVAEPLPPFTATTDVGADGGGGATSGVVTLDTLEYAELPALLYARTRYQ